MILLRIIFNLFFILGICFSATLNAGKPTSFAVCSFCTLALDADGNVWFFGYKEYIKPPLLENQSPNPCLKVVAGLRNIIQIAGDSDHLVALDKHGKVWVLGDNLNGQLGLGEEPRCAVPTLVPALPPIRQVDASSSSTIVLSEEGNVYAFGDLSELCLGSSAQNSPIQVMGFSSNISQILHCGCSWLALDNEGQLWGSGDNRFGQLGLGTSEEQVKLTKLDLPVVTQVDSNGFATFALDESGEVWFFGQFRNNRSLIPIKLENLPLVQQIAVGFDHIAFLDYDGCVWAYGENRYGQLGTGDNTDRERATLVASLHHIVGIAAGGNYTLALNWEGQLFAFGQNSYEELGFRSEGNIQNIPRLIPGLPPLNLPHYPQIKSGFSIR